MFRAALERFANSTDYVSGIDTSRRACNFLRRARFNAEKLINSLQRALRAAFLENAVRYRIRRRMSDAGGRRVRSFGAFRTVRAT